MKFITGKEVADKLGISITTAYKLIKDIKEHYSIKTNKINENHLKDYIGY